MFKLFAITVLSIVYVCNARPQNAPSADAQATLVSSTFADDGAGNFNYAFETSNGIKENANGQLKTIQVGDTSNQGEVQTGSFSYVAPDGTPITVEWVADENGFQPKGDHLPQPPTSSA